MVPKFIFKIVQPLTERLEQLERLAPQVVLDREVPVLVGLVVQAVHAVMAAPAGLAALGELVGLVQLPTAELVAQVVLAERVAQL
jgi:hypothetical protein